MRRARLSNGDLFHAPAMLAPIGGLMPLVVTFYDMYFLREPDAFPFWQTHVMRQFIPKILRRADRIIAISHFTKSEIGHFFPEINPDKIHVTWLGIDSSFRVRDNEDCRRSIRHKYSLTRPFILSVGTLEPRKNLVRLLKAYAKIKDRIDSDLLLVGGVGWKSGDLPRLIGDLGLRSRVRMLGYIPKEDLCILYNLADLFVYPSLYEGFGLPPLEAMASGCCVLTSQGSAIEEIMGPSAVLLNPFDVDDIADKMITLLLDPSMRARLSQMGLTRSHEFSWERCVRETATIYKNLLSQKDS
jgi:glycosyltransferase involved in cell wall biosynthesis